MSLVTSESFLKPAKRRYSVVVIPDFGDVRIQSITERERADWERSLYDDKGRYDIKKIAEAKCRLIALCVVDENGHRILSEAEAKRLPDTMDAATADAIFEACKSHVNLEGVETKNLSGSPETSVDVSPSSSPTDSDGYMSTKCSTK